MTRIVHALAFAFDFSVAVFGCLGTTRRWRSQPPLRSCLVPLLCSLSRSSLAVSVPSAGLPLPVPAPLLFPRPCLAEQPSAGHTRRRMRRIPRGCVRPSPLQLHPSRVLPNARRSRSDAAAALANGRGRSHSRLSPSPHRQPPHRLSHAQWWRSGRISACGRIDCLTALRCCIAAPPPATGSVLAAPLT